MKKKFPDELNRFRLREGPMASDDSAGFEGVFLIKSPWDRNTIFQVRSSEINTPDDGGITWEHVSIVVKRDLRGHLSQRFPDWREQRYLKDLFFDDHECPAVFIPNAEARAKTDHRICHFWRPDGGFSELPEAYREEFFPAIEFERDEEEPSVAEICRYRQEAAEARATSEARAGNARILDDVRRLLNGCERQSGDNLVSLVMNSQSFERLSELLKLD